MTKKEKDDPDGNDVKGFSLVELLITVAIITIITVTSVASFSRVGDMIRVKQGAGLIQDLIHQMEGQILRDEYEKITVRFLTDYLVIEYEPEGMEPDDLLTWSENKIHVNSKGVLHQTDNAGRSMNTETIPATKTIDPEDPANLFVKSDEDGWQYQLTNGNKISRKIALRHFNVHRENQSTKNDPLFLAPANVVLTLSAPYAKHQALPTEQEIVIKNKKEHAHESFTIR